MEIKINLGSKLQWLMVFIIVICATIVSGTRITDIYVNDTSHINATNFYQGGNSVCDSSNNCGYSTTNTANTTAEMITAINNTEYYNIQCLNSTDLQCSNCIGGTEIDESSLVPLIGWYNDSEQVQDVAGGMVTGNTETRISVIYDDALGKFNFTVDDMNDDNPEAGEVFWSDLFDEADANMGVGNLTEDVILETELDSLSELNTQLTDAVLVDTGTMTDAKWCKYVSASTDIQCNVEPVTDTNTANSTAEMITAINQTGYYYDITAQQCVKVYNVSYESTFNATYNTISINDPLDYDSLSDFTGSLTNAKICTYDSGLSLINCTYTDDDQPDSDAEVPDAITQSGAVWSNHTSGGGAKYDDNVLVIWGTDNDFCQKFNGTHFLEGASAC